MSSPFTKGAALDFLEARYGGLLNVRQADVAVGTSLVRAINGSPERISLTFVNLGVSVIILSPDQRTSTSHGIRLGSSGGFLTLSIEEDGILPTLEWNAIGDIAGGSLYVLSVEREARF